MAAEAAEAARRGVRVSVPSFPRAADDEVLVRSLTLPSDVKVGAPFEVVAEVYSSRAQPATLTLYRDEFINPLDGKKTVELAAGANSVRWKAEVAQSGFTTFKAVVAGAGKEKLRDTLPGNNSAVASLSVKGKPRVLYIEGEPGSAAYLANALKRESIDVDVRTSYGLPGSPRELAAYDLVILSDVAQTFVGPAQMAAIEGYVRDLGGGFIMAGGENSFGSGGYTGSRLEKLLPVRFDTEKKRDQPGLALALVIDRSGSMTGEKLELAKDAAKATAELLGADDLIAVIAFDSQPTSIVRLQRAANRVRIGSDISRLSAGGGTNILPALKEAYDQLDPARAKLKHVILLTDGQASYEGIRELCDEMAEHKITISAVGVGAEADKTLLTMIAERGGGRFYYTQSAQNMPKIFTKETTEVARNALVEEQVGVHVQKRAELLDGVGIESAPPLRGYVSTKPKPLADVILVSDLGEPILARWRVGLGQAAAFTSDVKNRWAINWLKWPGYGKFWAHLVRSTMRHSSSSGSGSGRSYELGVDVDPPRAHVTVDAIGADDKFVSGPGDDAAGDRSRAPERQARGDAAGDGARPLRRRLHARALRRVPLARDPQAERSDRRRVDGRAVAALPARVSGVAARRGAAPARRRAHRRPRRAEPGRSSSTRRASASPTTASCGPGACGSPRSCSSPTSPPAASASSDDLPDLP